MKKQLCLVLALLMLLSGFTGCSNQSATTETADNSEKTEESAEGVQAEAGDAVDAEAIEEDEEPSNLDTLPSASFDGDTIKAMTRTSSWWQITDLTVDEMTGEVINDAIYTRNLKFEELYNAKFEVEYPSSVLTSTRNIVSAGDDTYDFVVPSLTDSSQLAMEDSLVDLFRVDTIDLTNSAWDQNAVYYYSMLNKLYYGVSDISLGKNECAWLYMFNKNMINELGLEDPYELVRNGEWTFDKSLEMMTAAANDTNGNGEVDKNDTFGLATHEVNYYALMICAGEPVATKDENDSPVINAGSEAFNNVFDYLKDNFVDDSKTVIEYEGEIFQAGRALLCGQVIACVRLFREMEDDFGVIPCPKYNTEQESYYSYLIPYDVFASCIPISAKDVSRSGTVLQALAILSKEYITPAYYDVTITGKGVRDDESIEMLDIILNNVIYDIGRLYDWGGIASSVSSEIINQRSFATSYAKKAKAVDRAMTKTLDAFAGNTN